MPLQMQRGLRKSCRQPCATGFSGSAHRLAAGGSGGPRRHRGRRRHRYAVWKAKLPQQVMVPLVRSPHECDEPTATAEYWPVDSPVDSAAVWGAVRVSDELASQRSAAAVVVKKRTRGSRRSPQVLSVWRCWRPNSMRPVSSLRATMRTPVLSLPVLFSWTAAAVETTAPLRTASRATIAARRGVCYGVRPATPDRPVSTTIKKLGPALELSSVAPRVAGVLLGRSAVCPLLSHPGCSDGPDAWAGSHFAGGRGPATWSGLIQI